MERTLRAFSALRYFVRVFGGMVGELCDWKRRGAKADHGVTPWGCFGVTSWWSPGRGGEPEGETSALEGAKAHKPHGRSLKQLLLRTLWLCLDSGVPAAMLPCLVLPYLLFASRQGHAPHLHSSFLHEQQQQQQEQQHAPPMFGVSSLSARLPHLGTAASQDALASSRRAKESKGTDRTNDTSSLSSLLSLASSEAVADGLEDTSKVLQRLTSTMEGSDSWPAPARRRSESQGQQMGPLRNLKVYVYNMPTKYNYNLVKKDHRCLSYMFAAEVYFHHFILRSHVRTLNPEDANWFYTPLYQTCDLTDAGLPLPFRAPRMVRSAIAHIAMAHPYWNRTDGADHFFITPHDFGACFHFQEEKAIKRGILPLLRRATLVQTFGQKHHVCHKPGSIIIPPYAPPQRMHEHVISRTVPRSIYVYFRGLFYDTENDPQGGYYARGARASVWENFKDNPLFDMSPRHPLSYYEDMQRAVFCLCPLGWAPWSPRLVEAVVFGCIPVIIADDIVLPFADVIPWDKLAVFVKEGDVPKLDSILSAISPASILSKQRLLASPIVKRALLFGFPSQPGDAFHQILSGLSRKLPHPASAFLQPGQRGLDWSLGSPDDFKPWRPDDPVFW